MTDHNYCSSNLGAGPSRISVNCPSINEIKDKIADLIHATGARDLFRTDYDKQDGNRTLNPGQGSDKNYAERSSATLTCDDYTERVIIFSWKGD